MGRTWTAASFAVLLIMIAVMPGTSHAASWSFSSHPVQLAQNPAPDQPTEEPVAPVVAGKKSIGKGVMFSLVIPGAGQLYTNSWLRAVPWFAVEVVSWAMFAKYHGDGKDKTSEFEKYAGTRHVGANQPQEGYFNVNAYLLREYQIASNTEYNTAPYTGTLAEWSVMGWDERQEFFQEIEGYTHDVLTNDIQQYYEMIGKYINQFGYGWMDTYDPSADVFNQDAGFIWGPSGDDPSTVNFDGNSAMFYHYRDMRGEANDLLDKGNVAMEVVLVNHVLSALDAAFAVRRYNKHLEQSPLGDIKLHYDARTVDGALTRFMTVSVALN